MVVEILNTDENLGIRKGQWYEAETYSIDPSKFTLLSRVHKKTLKKFGKNPMCNQYRGEVKVVVFGESLPKYVWMVGDIDSDRKIALRYDGEEYWRHAGEWGVEFKIVDGKMISKHYMPSVHNKELIPCTEQEWRNDNRGYIDDIDFQTRIANKNLQNDEIAF